MNAIKTIALGCDHAGYLYKEAIREHLEARGITVKDFGTSSTESVDYPDYIGPAARAVATGEADAGIVLGGSGNGEAIAANKVKGVRCGLCWNEKSARLTRQHNNANVISIGERMVSQEDALLIVDAWLGSEFEGGRHDGRVQKVSEMEERFGA